MLDNTTYPWSFAPNGSGDLELTIKTETETSSRSPCVTITCIRPVIFNATNGFVWRDLSPPFSWEVTSDGVQANSTTCAPSCFKIPMLSEADLSYPSLTVKYNTVFSKTYNIVLQPDCTTQIISCQVVVFDATTANCASASVHSSTATCRVDASKNATVDFDGMNDVSNFMLRFSYSMYPNVVNCTNSLESPGQAMNINVCGNATTPMSVTANQTQQLVTFDNLTTKTSYVFATWFTSSDTKLACSVDEYFISTDGTNAGSFNGATLDLNSKTLSINYPTLWSNTTFTQGSSSVFYLIGK